MRCADLFLNGLSLQVTPIRPSLADLLQLHALPIDVTYSYLLGDDGRIEIFIERIACATPIRLDGEGCHLLIDAGTCLTPYLTRELEERLKEQLEQVASRQLAHDKNLQGETTVAMPPA